MPSTKHAATRTGLAPISRAQVRTTLLWYLALTAVGTAISQVAKALDIPAGDAVKMAGFIIASAVVVLMRPWRS